MAERQNTNGNTTRRKSTSAREVGRPTSAIRKTANTKRDPPSRQCEVPAFINDYLVSQGKPAPFPKRGSLNSKHFKEAATSIFRLIDPGFPGFSGDKFHIEFKDLMEVAGYPYTVRQNDLQSFGAAQRIGPALDPLYWTISLLKADEELKQEAQLEIEKNEDMGYHLFFFNFLRSAYERWLSEGDNSIHQFESEVSSIFKKDTLKRNQCNIELQRLLNDKKREWESLEVAGDPRDTLANEVQRLTREVAERNASLQSAENEHQQAMTSLDELKDGIASETARGRTLESELQTAKTEIRSKGINTDELKVMLHQIRQIEKETDDLAKKSSDAEAETRMVADGHQDRSEAIVRLSEDINESLRRLDVSRTVEVHPDAGTVHEILGIDVDELESAIQAQRPSPQKVSRERNKIAGERAEIQRQMQALDREAQDIRGEIEMIKGGRRKDAGRLKRILDKLVADTREKQQETQTEKMQCDKKLRDLDARFKEFQKHIKEGLAGLARELQVANGC